MPRAPKQCATPGCDTRVVGRSYCPSHQPVGWKSGGWSRTSTAEHRRWRDAVLERDRGVCQIRGRRCVGVATEADHVIPVADGGPEFELANGQAACGPCHREKTGRHATTKAAKRRRGAPARVVGQVSTSPRPPI